MPPQHRLNEKVAAYRIVEYAGRDNHRSLYLSIKDYAPGLFWLLASDTSLEELMKGLISPDLFESKGKHYLAWPAQNISVATLASLMPVMDPTFIGWRWAGLAESLGTFHTQGQVYQRNNAFTLSNFMFNEQTQIMALSFRPLADDSPNFAAPEAANEAFTPSSDVYSLGASLLALLGEPSAEELLIGKQSATGQLASRPKLQAVLQRATDPDPSKRFRDGHQFAQALAKTLSPPKMIKVNRPARPSKQAGRAFSVIDGTIMTLGPVIALVVLALGLYVLVNGTAGLKFDWPFLAK